MIEVKTLEKGIMLEAEGTPEDITAETCAVVKKLYEHIKKFSKPAAFAFMSTVEKCAEENVRKDFPKERLNYLLDKLLEDFSKEEKEEEEDENVIHIKS